MPIEKRIEKLNARVQKIEEQLKKVEDRVPYVNIVPRELFQFAKQQPPSDALRTACASLDKWCKENVTSLLRARGFCGVEERIQAIKSALAEDAPIEDLEFLCCEVESDKKGDVKFFDSDGHIWIMKKEIPKLRAWLTKAGA